MGLRRGLRMTLPRLRKKRGITVKESVFTKNMAEAMLGCPPQTQSPTHGHTCRKSCRHLLEKMHKLMSWSRSLCQ